MPARPPRGAPQLDSRTATGWSVLGLGEGSIVDRRRVALALACGGVLAVVPAGVGLSQADLEQPRLGPQLSASVPSLTKSVHAAAGRVLVSDPSLAKT
ncbi:MAG: hypothetical protein QOJ85_1463 [Solirubrobacteraceae bacterium]|jgi:hypothetical protein|nr:hypothetical protein [Solirubrobacteraceae bacterium]